MDTTKQPNNLICLCGHTHIYMSTPLPLKPTIVCYERGQEEYNWGFYICTCKNYRIDNLRYLEQLYDKKTNRSEVF